MSAAARILGAFGLRLPVFGPSRAGAVPGAGAQPDSTKSLREDGTWSNAGGVASSRTISTTAPLTGGGDLTANRTLAISPADVSNPGSMSADAFNKVESLASAAFGGTASTTNATVTTCGFYQMADNQTAVLTVTVAAHRDNHTQGAGYVLVGAFRRSGGTVTQIGVTTVLSAREDNTAWDAILNISGTTVRVRVTGAAAVNIAWRSTAVVTVA